MWDFGEGLSCLFRVAVVAVILLCVACWAIGHYL